jgi:hypothetical protein
MTELSDAECERIIAAIRAEVAGASSCSCLTCRGWRGGKIEWFPPWPPPAPGSHESDLIRRNTYGHDICPGVTDPQHDREYETARQWSEANQ